MAEAGGKKLISLISSIINPFMKIYRQNELTVNRVLFSNAASAACEVIHISVSATDDSVVAIFGTQMQNFWICMPLLASKQVKNEYSWHNSTVITIQIRTIGLQTNKQTKPSAIGESKAKKTKFCLLSVIANKNAFAVLTSKNIN